MAGDFPAKYLKMIEKEGVRLQAYIRYLNAHSSYYRQPQNHCYPGPIF